MAALEQALLPEIAAWRLELARVKELRGVDLGLPLELCAASCVGMSLGFAVRTHRDSCVAGMSETMFWPHRNETTSEGETLCFTVTEARLCFDIGTRPALLFTPGQLWHGTVPHEGTSKAVGLALISKRRDLLGGRASSAGASGT